MPDLPHHLHATISGNASIRPSAASEMVIDLVAARAPGGFGHLEEVATKAELAEVVHGSTRLAGFATTR